MRLCLKMEEGTHPKLSSDLYMGTVAHTSQHTNIIHTQIKFKNNEEIKFLKRKNEGVWSKRIYPMPFDMISERAVSC